MVLIALGYILNAFQIVNNCYIGMTRVMVAMSLDRLLPEWVSRVSDRLHTPVNAHLAYFIASIPVILVYNLWGSWTALTLGRHLRLRLRVRRHRACRRLDAVPRQGALRRLTGRGLQDGKHSNGHGLRPDRRRRRRGHGADVHVLERARPDQPAAYQVVFGVLVVSIIWYFLAKMVQRSHGINVDFAFKEIPPE